MKPFLKQLAEYTIETFGTDNLERVCFIFPNRRSGVFFKHYLMQLGKGIYWLPEIFPISDFISRFSTLEKADPIDVSFELYRIYSSMVTTPESYDEFYFWGEMMTGDFDEIDKYLVPAGKLFKNIVDLKEIDNAFGDFEPKEMEVIREFWMHFFKQNKSEEQIRFMDTWKILFPMYEELRNRLRKSGLGYEGMQYREIAELIRNNEFPESGWDKIIVAGFNALNKAEKVLFRHLKNLGKGMFFWDYDKEYIENRYAEAGRFLRKNMEEFPPVNANWPVNFMKERKKIKIFELPSDVLQAKQLGRLLSAEADKITADFDNTAVIPGDENLIGPLISSLPENMPHINITMGYPLQHTTAFSFTDQILKLQKNLSRQPEKYSRRFYYRDVLSVLNHQYPIASGAPDIIHERNIIYIKPEFFGSNELLKNIFRKIGDTREMAAYLRSILEQIISLNISRKDEGFDYDMEKDFAVYIIQRINKLEQIFDKDPGNKGIDTFVRLLRKILNAAKVPFEGEPLRGLQIMGILESRLLDFKNLVFLSMNEGIIPRSHSFFSFIPVKLRHGFSMPVREDHDAIYAYYFYRLLQRAENIFILYNSRADGLKSGEKSRYLYQLEYLSPLKPECKSLAFRISSSAPKEIIIKKTTDILKKLDEFTIEGNKGLSPTAIITWLECRLRFYLSYIAGLREQDGCNPKCHFVREYSPSCNESDLQ